MTDRSRTPQRHLQGARDRGRRHGQNVDPIDICFNRSFARDAEALFFVDDEQPEFEGESFESSRCVPTTSRPPRPRARQDGARSRRS